MKIVFLSDTHLGFDYPLRPRSNRQRRGESFYENFQKVLDYAIEQKADLVLHGGDFFFRSKLNSIVIDKAYQMLDDFNNSGIPFVVIPGNHERSKLPESFILHYPNIHVIADLDEMKFSIDGVNLNIIGFPYQKQIDQNFPLLMKNINLDESNFNLLLVHQIFYGAKVGSHNYTFRHGSEVIQNRDLPPQLDLILCGHIHRKQNLSCKTNNEKVIPIFFSGSTQRTSAQENCEPKGFYEIEIMPDKTLKYIFVELPADMVEIRKY